MAGQDHAGGLIGTVGVRGVDMGATADDRLLSMLSSSRGSPGAGLLHGSGSIPLGAALRASYTNTSLSSSLGAGPSFQAGDASLHSFSQLYAAGVGQPAQYSSRMSGAVDELERLQGELHASRAEEQRIRQAVHLHEAVIQKNRQELNRYRSYMEQRDLNVQQMIRGQDQRMQLVLEEYKRRYDGERLRLQEALVKSANYAQVVSDALNECLAIERQLFGYTPEDLRAPARPPKAPATSLLQALGPMSEADDRSDARSAYSNLGGSSMGGSMGNSMDAETMLA